MTAKAAALAALATYDAVYVQFMGGNATADELNNAADAADAAISAAYPEE